MSHYIITTGGRDADTSVRDDIRDVLFLLRGLHGSDLRVMHGAARGVDTWVQEICDELGIRVKAYPADWEGSGKRAGLERNLKMISLACSWLAQGHTAQVVAFPGGTGTAHCVTHAEAAGLDVSHIVATEPGAVIRT